MWSGRTAATILILLETFFGIRANAAEPAIPDLKVTVSWVGNTFSGVPWPGYVPLGIDDISVSGDGIVATNSGYNESATGVVTFKDGAFFGSTDHQYGGMDKRSAVAEDPDNEYLFYNTYHRYGYGVGRVLASGNTDPKNVVMEGPQNWPDRGFAGRIITGLSLQNGLLFVSDSTPTASPAQLEQLGKLEKNAATHWKDFCGISVVDKRTLRVLRSFPLDSPGKLAATHDGNVWAIQGQGAVRRDQPVRIVKLSGKDGSILTTVDAVKTVGAIAVDGRDRLLVGDTGPDNNIKIFLPDGKPAGSFGMAGGIFAGPTPGLLGPARFEKPRGLGVDASGKLYVLSVGAVWPAANRIECYAPEGETWGHLEWRVAGMMSGDAATFDPQHDDTLYTSHAIFKMDWSRPPGQEWSYFATTLDRTQFPDDPRRGIFAQGAAGRGTFGIRILQGHRFLYSGLNNVEVSRFDDAHGTIGIPSAYVCLRDPSTDAAASDWPRTRPKFGGWIWHDSNGNGQYDSEEYEAFEPGKAGISGVSDVDSGANIWWFPANAAAGSAAHVLSPDAALDPGGNPVYRAANVQAKAMPAGFQKFGLCHLDDTTGDLYIAAKRADVEDYTLARYEGWREHRDNATATWAIDHIAKHTRHEVWIPKQEDNDIGALKSAGDYVFLASGIGNSVRIFQKTDGHCIGRLTGEFSHNSTFDDTHGFHVHQRANGEYVIVMMDFLHNKNLMYRWRP